MTKHRCEQGVLPFVCEGDTYLELSVEYDVYDQDSGESQKIREVVEPNFCPFCGYSPKGDMHLKNITD